MTTDGSFPTIIQGGMGAAVSSWPLARAVSQAGQLGVLSGTALDEILVRRLQLGDPDGNLRRALEDFPLSEIAARVLDRYFIPGGKAPDAPFRPSPMATGDMTQEAMELIVVGNFVEVYLAKEDHEGIVGINYLEKIQLPTLPSLFGAMLAGVDYVLMGAGIPRTIPGILDQLSRGEAVEMALNVHGATPEDRFVTRFDPASLFGGEFPWVKRPRFLAIVASATLATMLARKSTGEVDGFVVEGPTAGGHNAPPRGAMQYNDRGEPIYGKRDAANLATFRKLEKPFWLAGSYGSPERLAEALAEGAAGVQVGTAFAFCEESGLEESIKRRVLAESRQQTPDVLTDPVASPAGFPFKVLDIPGSLSDADVYQARPRICDLGYLRHAYRREDGSFGWRCPAGPVEGYLHAGGELAETEGRKCLCNALVANVGLAQVRPDGSLEEPLVTCGDDVRQVARFLPSPEADRYHARDVVARILAGIPHRCGTGH